MFALMTTLEREKSPAFALSSLEPSFIPQCKRSMIKKQLRFNVLHQGDCLGLQKDRPYTDILPELESFII